jgi:hypothetical protein
LVWLGRRRGFEGHLIHVSAEAHRPIVGRDGFGVEEESGYFPGEDLCQGFVLGWGLGFHGSEGCHVPGETLGQVVALREVGLVGREGVPDGVVEEGDVCRVRDFHGLEMIWDSVVDSVKAIVGLRPSFSAHVRLGEGHPSRILDWIVFGVVPFRDRLLMVCRCGIPHLAKNERDVGHPGFVRGKDSWVVVFGLVF